MPAASQWRFLATDSALTRPLAGHVDFVVWPENEFTRADNKDLTDQVARLASETGAWIAVDTLWQAPGGLHDTAVLFSPEGREVLRRAQINFVPGEVAAGISPGLRDFPIADTRRARIMLLPVDNDFDGNGSFSPFHAANAFFWRRKIAWLLCRHDHRAFAGHRPYGRITVEGQVNENAWRWTGRGHPEKHGLAQPQGSGLAAVKHAGSGLLH